jgi:hypothetical protein
MEILFLVILLLFLAFIGGGYYKFRYKIASADQALVVTGGKKEPLILPGGGAFVPPNRKYDYFPIGVMTVRSSDQETQTSTLVPIVVQWTAQLRVDVNTAGSLEKAVRGFGGYETKDIANSLQQTLDGEVRAVVAEMTPEEVVTDKVAFSERVSEGVARRMEDLGYQLVSLNISEVSDNNQHYYNLAAADRETKREESEKLTARANQKVAVEKAEANKIAKQAELESNLSVDEKEREVRLRRAKIKEETDVAEADAEIAGQLRREERNKDLAVRQGEVLVIQAKQDQDAALAQREANLTRAETDKHRATIEAETAAKRSEIDANAFARRSEINAAAQAKVSETEAAGAARAATAKAKGEAEAARLRAEGEAEAVKVAAKARAEEISSTGLAEAEVRRAQGEAEAEATRAKGAAEAEVKRMMAEAMAAHEGANLKISIAEIESHTRIAIADAISAAVNEVGSNATFIDMGGSSANGNLLTGVLGDLPELLKKLDIKNQALNGESFAETLHSTIRAVNDKKPSQQAPEADESPVAAAAEAEPLEAETTTEETSTYSESNPVLEELVLEED